MPIEPNEPKSVRATPKPWSSDEVRTLINLWNTDYTNADIARILGRQEIAVAVKARRTNLGSKMPREFVAARKKRDCLRCSRPFFSTGPGNRVCDACKDTDDWRMGNDFHAVSCG